MDYEKLRKLDVANKVENRMRGELERSFPAPLNDDAIVSIFLTAFEDLWDEAFKVGYEVGWDMAYRGFSFESYPLVYSKVTE